MMKVKPMNAPSTASWAARTVLLSRVGPMVLLTNSSINVAIGQGGVLNCRSIGVIQEAVTPSGVAEASRAAHTVHDGRAGNGAVDARTTRARPGRSPSPPNGAAGAA